VRFAQGFLSRLGSDAEPVRIAEFSSENGEKNKRPKWRNEQIKVKGLLRVPCA
jgi:hypothetical protein